MPITKKGFTPPEIQTAWFRPGFKKIEWFSLPGSYEYWAFLFSFMERLTLEYGGIFATWQIRLIVSVINMFKKIKASLKNCLLPDLRVTGKWRNVLSCQYTAIFDFPVPWFRTKNRIFQGILKTLFVSNAGEEIVGDEKPRDTGTWKMNFKIL